MSSIVVGVSDCRVVNDGASSLITYALGSCIGISIYDPARKAGGLLHYMLPESSLDPEKARLNPHMFADTGIAALLDSMTKAGSDPRRCQVKLAGGARMLMGEAALEIGKRNYLAAKKQLWKMGIMIAAEAIGGEVSRNVRLELSSGRFLVREAAGPEQELKPKRNGGATCPIAS